MELSGGYALPNYINSYNRLSDKPLRDPRHFEHHADQTHLEVVIDSVKTETQNLRYGVGSAIKFLSDRDRPINLDLIADHFLAIFPIMIGI